ncbi:MAG TPA: hypothetical protein PKL15_16685 [Saprospiraceae bacterium]|nr:hypothetical protein [Saprospiraceae bacterium]HNL40204.1 hypothetical protein [Saprospiraceae bacterium]HNM27083.1 hypothetical protein [Saprospiraceae bacterium]
MSNIQMNPKLRAVLAVVAGIVVASVVSVAVKIYSRYEPPADMDFNDALQMKAWVESLPATTLYYVIAGYAFGAFVGGWLTNKLAQQTHYRPALVTGMALFFYSFVDLATIPHPEWFMWTATVCLVLFAGLGGLLVPRKPAS